MTVALNFSDKPAAVPYSGSVVMSNAGKTVFDGKLGPWEAVILQ